MGFDVYTDVGRLFSGTTPVVVSNQVLVRWFDSIYKDMGGDERHSFHVFLHMFGFQLRLNGFKCCEILILRGCSDACDVEEVSLGLEALSIEKEDIYEHKYDKMMEEVLSEYLSVNVGRSSVSQFYDGLGMSTMPLLLVTVNGPSLFFSPSLIKNFNVAIIGNNVLMKSSRFDGLLCGTNKEGILHKGYQEVVCMLSKMKVGLSEEICTDHEVEFSNIEPYGEMSMFEHRAVEGVDVNLYRQAEEDIIAYRCFDDKEKGYQYVKTTKKISRQDEKQFAKRMGDIHHYASTLYAGGMCNLFMPNNVVEDVLEEKDGSSSDESSSSSDEEDKKIVRNAYKKEGKKKNAKQVKKSKADVIREENEKRLREEELRKSLKSLDNVIGVVSGLRKLEEKLGVLDSLSIGKKSQFEEISIALLLVRIDVYLIAWKDDVYHRPGITSSVVDSDMNNAVAIVDLIYQIYDNHFETITLEQLENNILNALCCLGFMDAVEMILAEYFRKKECSVGKGKGFDKYQARVLERMNTRSISMAMYHISYDFIAFQLMFCGHILMRSLKPMPDKRVSFVPDKWQKKLLDTVDRSGSALVTAPTSSGKTFVCYYAMKKVLDSKDAKDVIVYVAPSKALMNQVVADIYARFNNKISSSSGAKLFGTLSDIEASNFMECKVLVTFPLVFEKVAFSPIFASFWTRNIKYIILDEVHIIGEAEYASIWEKIVFVSKCPILALSATIANQECIRTWITKVQKCIGGRKCKLITGSERYSDLKKYVYDPPEKKVDPCILESIKTKRSSTNSETRIVQIHPLLTFSYNDIKNRYVSPDNFLSGDTVRLYDRISRLRFSDEHTERLFRDLDYKKYFRGRFRILKKDYREYSNLLNEEFKKNIDNIENSEEEVEGVLQDLTSKSRDSFSRIDGELEEKTDLEYIKENILSLLVDLNSEDKLPVIVFNMDRDFCTELAVSVYKDLVRAEESKHRESRGSSSLVSMLNRVQKKIKRQRDLEVKQDKDAWMEESLREEELIDLTNKVNKMDSDLTFQDARYKLRDVDVDEIIKKYRIRKEFYRKGYIPILMEALKRGIGVHHQGVPRKYVLIVEHLFRLRHLRVIMATSTLAFGINMPCKTVVFAGDDIRLTPLEYRQMSGRAGRRGFDDLGHVVFFGVPQKKVDRLMMSSLPSIRGNYPVDAILILETLNMNNMDVSSIKDKTRQKDVIDLSRIVYKRLVSAPLLNEPSEILKEDQLLSNIELLLSYLFSMGFVTDKGKPTIYSYLPLYVPSASPYSFIFLYLLRCKSFYDMFLSGDAEEHGQEGERKEDLIMSVLCHFFARTYTADPSKSIRSLPKAVQKDLERYNLKLLRLLSLHVSRYIGEDIDLRHYIRMREGMVIEDFTKLLFYVEDLCRRRGKVHEDLVLVIQLFPFYSIPPNMYVNGFIHHYFRTRDLSTVASVYHIEEKDMWTQMIVMDEILVGIVLFIMSIEKGFKDVDSGETGRLMGHLKFFMDLRKEYIEKFRVMWA